ncbi:hypothetical protein SO078_17440 (plasmid) [Sinorhizobium meliloti]|uniref:hypothetical protein n=1 Tax=Rhizobium meliloti TaxID=382 RepID=UPI002D77B071|nr:hypothetical protein [Sinorhizobium meliloti]WRQ70254.1 hypothetical protein SO078_17440 [Sinorhizobium meliloti]
MSALKKPAPESEAHRIARLMRSPADIMKPERLAAIQPSRISASRALMSRAVGQRWQILCKRFDIDAKGNGVAEYRIDIGGWRFSFPVYSFEPSPHGRTGRIIGRAWDMMGALVEGDMSERDFVTTRTELPKLYEGRATPGTLIWCRSNRSGRFFEGAKAALQAGRQPNVAELAQTCYLMRNTGLDGNGTFGTKSFLAYGGDHPLRWSLAAQMLCAYMMRVFAQDLLAHLVRLEAPAAPQMAIELRRFLGVGNGSALGLMLFVNNHPRLIERWLFIREEAIARAKALTPDEAGSEIAKLLSLVDKAITFRSEDRVQYENVTRSEVVARELGVIRDAVANLLTRWQSGSRFESEPFAELAASLECRVHAEAMETLHSLLIELVGEEADQLVEGLVIDEELTGRPEMPVARLREILRNDYAWAFGLDLDIEPGKRYVWYKSVSAEEPRRGPAAEVGENVVNLGLDLPRLVVALDRDLAAADPTLSTARFLLAHPEHRAIATRVQALAGTGLHSPHADIMSGAFTPAHITRLLNVGIHGIDKTRDFLDRNLRGVLFHGAPVPEDIAAGSADDLWFYPSEPCL